MILMLCTLILAGSLRAMTVEDLEQSSNLTPEGFARLFESFEFEYHDEVQSPELFLATKSGDCDDYSTLAARILKQQGYTPRLIAVRMPKVVHVVCYINETGSYLDYNLRADSNRLVRANAQLADIARSVARSYGTKWISASEFSYDGSAKRLVQTVVETRDRQLAGLFHAIGLY